MNTIDSTTRRALRAQAHALNPVVMIGNHGLTESVIKEIDRSLKAHELIKVRVSGVEHDARAKISEDICEKTGAVPVQHIGKILVLYRENPEKVVASPAVKPRPARTEARSRRPTKVPQRRPARPTTRLNRTR